MYVCMCVYIYIYIHVYIYIYIYGCPVRVSAVALYSNILHTILIIHYAITYYTLYYILSYTVSSLGRFSALALRLS